MAITVLDPAPPATPTFARVPVLAIAAVVAMVQFMVAALSPSYWLDEVYMLAIGRHHLDWGSADQPPLTPLLAALMDAIAPGSILVLRIPAVLATATAVVVAALIARELGGDRRAQILTAGAQATALWAALGGHWMAPYTLEPVTWLVILWLLVRWVRVRDDRLLLALGAAAGVAAQTKFQVLLLCAVLLLAAGVCGPRELLRRPLLWAGIGVGALIALPTLWWQAANGWPQLRMGAVVASEAEVLYGGRPVIAVALVLLAGVAGAVLGIYGVGRLLRNGELRFLGLAVVVLFVFFVATGGRPYYLAGVYGLLSAAGAVGLQRRREAGRTRWRWLVRPGYALSVVAAVGLSVVGLATSPGAVDTGEQIAQRTAAAYHALPAAERERTAILGGSYLLAAYVDGYAPRYDTPPAYSTNRGYGYFPPPPETQDAALYVGPPDELRPYFAEIRMVVDGGPDATVWLCTGRQESWAVMWSELRSLTVV